MLIRKKLPKKWTISNGATWKGQSIEFLWHAFALHAFWNGKLRIEHVLAGQMWFKANEKHSFDIQYEKIALTDFNSMQEFSSQIIKFTQDSTWNKIVSKAISAVGKLYFEYGHRICIYVRIKGNRVSKCGYSNQRINATMTHACCSTIR